MSTVRMTVEQCIDLGLWDKYIEWSGINPYAINEGLINNDDEIVFDSEFKKEDQEEESKLIYMIITYDMNMENEDTDYLYTTKENYKKDMSEKINEIINSSRIIRLARLETLDD